MKRIRRRPAARKPAVNPRPVKAWATLRDGDYMPCLWHSRAAAEANADPDERVYRAQVQLLREVKKRPRPYDGNPF